MTSTQQLASILAQFLATNAPTALQDELKKLQEIHATEARELQALRDDYATIAGEYQKIQASYDSLNAAYNTLISRVGALEARNTTDDQAIDDALKGFTGQPTPPAGDNEQPAPAAVETEAPPETEPAEPVVESKTGE